MTAYLLPPEEDVPARPTAHLADAVATASQLRHAVDLDRLGAQLPGLLAELRAAWHHTTGSAQERVFGLLAETYYAAGQLASKLGYTDLAAISVDRYEWSAGRSADTCCTATTALATLNQARRTAPQQTRDTLRSTRQSEPLARADKRRTDTLANFVGWLNITG